MAVKKDEKTGTWYFYGSYKMKNGKYRQYKKSAILFYSFKNL